MKRLLKRKADALVQSQDISLDTGLVKIPKKKARADTSLEKDIEKFVWQTFLKTLGDPIEAMVQRVLEDAFGKKMGRHVGTTLEHTVEAILEEILEKILGKVLAKHLEGIMEALVEQALGKVLNSALEKSLVRNLDRALDRSLRKSLERTLRLFLDLSVKPRRSLASRIKSFFGWKRKNDETTTDEAVAGQAS